MKYVEVEPLKKGSLGKVSLIQEAAYTKLSSFCVKKLREAKLVTSASSFTVDLDNSRGAVIKTMAKLASTFQKAAVKQMPFLNYVEKGPLVSTSGSSVRLLVVGPWQKISRSQWELHRERHTSLQYLDDKTFKLLSRFSRYVNLRALKSSVPVEIRVHPVVSINPLDGTALSSDEEGLVTEVRVRWEHIVCLILVTRSYEPFDAYFAGLPVSQKDKTAWARYLQYRADLPDEEKALLPGLYDSTVWESVPLDRFRIYNPAYHHLNVPSKIFNFIEDARKVVRTLSRKTSYAAEAFDIGTP